MCGVVASIGYPGALDRVRTGVERLAHRGVRSRSEYGLEWAVGHVRLPIVGTGEDHDQPAQSGRWVVAFVGELLDFREEDPSAECDLETVVQEWVERGPDGFRRHDGFWSVVAVDRTDRSLHCLVDYLSQKPLYVRVDEGWAAVASEPDAVAALGPVTLDPVYLSAAVKWGYCPETWRTPYREVRRMCPGEYAVLRPREGRGSWSKPDELSPVSASDGELRSLVEEAVRRRVTSSDVPVACLVSGGLDSSIVWTLAGRHGDVRAYHVENREREDCLRVAPGAEVLDLAGVTAEGALEYMQEPLDLGSLLPQVALSDAVGRAGYSVCLTGDGADETFGGYGRSLRYDSQASDVWHELVAWHLPRLDRVMMRNRVEVRSPFLARRVVQAALALPREARTDKRILRDLFRGDLPPGQADVPKRALRTTAVERDRESWSRNLVEMFSRRKLCP